MQAAGKQHCHKAAAVSAELALIKEHRRHEALMWAALSAASSLADKQHRHEAPNLVLALAELTLTDEQCCHKAAKQAAALAELALAKSNIAMRWQRKQQCLQRALLSTSAAIMRQPHELRSRQNWCSPRSNVAMRRPRGRKDWPMRHASNIAESQPNALRHRQSWHWLWSKPRYRQIWRYPSRLWWRISGARRKPPKQRRSDNECVMVPVLLPNPVNAEIRCIRVECSLLTAPLDAILAKIECNDIAHEARALPTTTLPHPAAMLSTPPRPMTYVGAVLSMMGGSTHGTSLTLAPLAIPSPIVDGQLRTVPQCA